MKWAYKIVISALILAVIVSAAFTLVYFSKVNRVYEENSINVFGSHPDFHFSLILNSEDDKYWQDYKEGVFEAGKAYNAAIEYNPVSGPDSAVKTAEYINIANKSNLDGIIVNGENNDEYSDAINNATQAGINIVVGITGSFDSSRLVYVGTNFYDYGTQAAKLIAQAGAEYPKINLAVILSAINKGDTEKSATSQSDRMMSGLKNVIENGNKINLLCTLYRNNDLLGAEDLTRNILTQHPDVNAIFCTNAKDTVAATRVIVERNLVGKVAIVGTDMTDEIKNYIKKGVIFGVLERNGKLAGYKSVEILCNSKGNAFQTSYKNIGIDIYTLINIKQVE